MRSFPVWVSVVVVVGLLIVSSDADGEAVVLEGGADPRLAALQKVQSIIGVKPAGPEYTQEELDEMKGPEVVKEPPLPRKLQRKMDNLEAELKEIKDERPYFTEKIKTDLRASNNMKKEKYYKKMLRGSQYKKKLAGKVARAAKRITNAVAAAGRLRAINKVLLKKAGFTDSLKATELRTKKKLAAAVEVTSTLEQKAVTDQKEIAKLQSEVESLKSGVASQVDENVPDCAKDDIKCEIKKQKLLAQQAHMKASELHKSAAETHSKDGEHDEAAKSSDMSKRSKEAAEADILKVDKEEKASDEAAKESDAAKEDEEKAKDLEKKAKEEKKEAKKEKKEAKDAKKAKDKAEKLQKEADKAKEAAGIDEDDDDEDEVRESDSSAVNDDDDDDEDSKVSTADDDDAVGKLGDDDSDSDEDVKNAEASDEVDVETDDSDDVDEDGGDDADEDLGEGMDLSKILTSLFE